MLKRIFTLAGLGALVLIFILASLASASSPPLGASAAGDLYAPDRILVRFAPGVSASTRAAIHRANGAVVLGEIPQIGVQVLRVPSNRVPEMVAAYSRNPNVLYAEPDYVAYAVGDPNDEHFTKQWGLHNAGQTGGMVDADIDAPEAWDITTGGSDVKIAILDTGIDQDHEDLASKIVANEDFTGSGVDDLYGHGTHVAGIAAAITNNDPDGDGAGMGVAGVGYNSSLMNVKVLNDQGSGYYSWIANGMTWATNNGAHVINMSLGGYRRSRTLENAVNYAWNNEVVLAAAAGNDGTSRKLYPAAYTNCIAVAATDDDDQRVDEPGWWASNYGDWVDVAAPGLYIYSTFPNHSYAIGKDLNYDYGSGTSMSTPFVSGLAALVWATEYGTNNSAVRDQIEATADPIPGTGTYWVHGRINACKAVGGTECDGPVNEPPTVSITSPVDGSIFDSGATIPFEGTATDTEDGDLTASLVWTSSIDGQIGTGGSFSTTLSDGNHTITASVTDSGGATGSDSVSITVGTPSEPTTVSVASITYSTEGGRNQDKHLNITVALVDDLGNAVAGASVSIDLFLDGLLYGSRTGMTETDGTVTFRFNNAPSGCYTETGSVFKEGLTWDESWPDSLPTDPFCK